MAMKDHYHSQFKVMLVWPGKKILTSLRGTKNEPPLNVSRFSREDSSACYVFSSFTKYLLWIGFLEFYFFRILMVITPSNSWKNICIAY